MLHKIINEFMWQDGKMINFGSHPDSKNKQKQN